METPPAHAAVCPRCGYNLYALTVPRCPECGLTFTAEQWHSGRLCDPAPTSVDQADEWQPHQVMLGSLRDLVRATSDPRWPLAGMDPVGKPASAILALLGGILWLWLAAALPLTFAGVLHGRASPAAAAKVAMLEWSPRIIVLGLASGILSLGVMLLRRRDDLIAQTTRYRARLTCHWVVGSAAYTVIALSLGCLLVPELSTGIPHPWPLLSLWPAIAVRRRSRTAGVPQPRQAPWHIALIGIGLAILFGLAGLLVPRSLEPPIWACF